MSAQVLREFWLESAVSFLNDHLEKNELVRVDVRVSCGWPSRGGAGGPGPDRQSRDRGGGQRGNRRTAGGDAGRRPRRNRNPG